MNLLKHETKQMEPAFDRFDRLFDDWMGRFPFRRPTLFGQGWIADEGIRIDEYRENGSLVVKAELPGIDPDRDVELTVFEGTLRIEAQRREEETTEDKGYVRQELRYGSFIRTLPLPEGVSEDDIKASYKDGILEIRIPVPQAQPVKKLAITKS